jgi:hypothetical protein
MTPDDLGWGSPCPAEKIVTFQAGGISLTAHKSAAPIFAAFIEDVVSRGYPVAGAVRDDWGYNCRRIAGSDSWSWHAWGMAIDLNALKNPMGPTLVTDMPPWIDDVAAQYGIVWGGNFNSRKDAMHFELHLNPTQALSMRLRIEREDMPTIEEVEAAVKRALDNRFKTKGTATRVGHLELVRRGTAHLDDDEANILAAVAFAVGGDPTPILEELRKLPGETVKAIKDAL